VRDSDSLVSFDALTIVRDTLASSAELRPEAVRHLESVLPDVAVARVARAAIYLLSLYSEDPGIVDSIIKALSSSSAATLSDAPAPVIVLSDGTYGQRSRRGAADSDTITSRLPREPYLVAAISISLARLCLRLPSANASGAAAFVRELATTAGAARESKRIGLALAALEGRADPRIQELLVDACAESFTRHVTSQQNEIIVRPVAPSANISQAVGEALSFASILGRRFDAPPRVAREAPRSRGSLCQMTGTSDAIFCECRVIANKFDICLDFRLLNQTQTELRNVRVEMNCVGKLELIDRPAGIALQANAAEYVRFSVKVTSAEAGRVFGTITYDVGGGSSDQRLLPLATITVSPADYMAPAQIDQAAFRKKWDEFEWEKKQPVNAPAGTLAEFIGKICSSGKMQMVQEADLTLPFLTTNLYSKSFFGEEVLANVNVELEGGHVTGFIRLRTDTQAMALAFARLIQSIE
jgi:hypothetical protein